MAYAHETQHEKIIRGLVQNPPPFPPYRISRKRCQGVTHCGLRFRRWEWRSSCTAARRAQTR